MENKALNKFFLCVEKKKRKRRKRKKKREIPCYVTELAEVISVCLVIRMVFVISVESCDR